MDRAQKWLKSLERPARKCGAILVSLSLFAGAGSVPAGAATDSWSTSPVSGNFSGVNWTLASSTPGAPTGVAATGDALVFGTSSITTLTNDDVGFSFAGLTFNAGASAFTIHGNQFTITNNVTNSSTSLQTFGAAILSNSNRTFTMTTGGGNFTLNGIYSGTGNLTTAGTGTITLNGANNYSGSTTIGSTTSVNIGNATAFGTGAVSFSGGAVVDNTSGAAITLTNNNAYSFGGALTFGAAAGTGTTANSIDFGTNAFSDSGDRTITMNGGGAIAIGTLTDTGSGAHTLTVNLGTNTASTSILTIRGYQLNLTTDTTHTAANPQIITGTGNIIINGAITDGGGIGGIRKNGNGVLTLSGSGNTYSGGLTATTGTVNLNSTSALGVGGTFTWSGGLIDNTTGAAVVMTTSNTTLWNGDTGFSTSAGTAANSITFNGAFTETAAHTMTLNGAGSLTFNGAYAYIGASTYTAGNTFNNGTGTTATTAINFNGYNLAASGVTGSIQQVAGSANVNFNGAVTDSGNSSTNTLNFTGSGAYALKGNNTITGLLRMSGSGSLSISGNNSAESGGITVSAGKLNVNSSNALGTGTFSISGGVFDNTSGAAIVSALNPAIVIGNDITFGTSAGTSANSLNLGTGSVSSTASRTITINGADSLVFGGQLVNAGPADQGRTFVFNNGTGTTAATSVSVGGFYLTSAGSTAGRTDTVQGSANVIFTGALTDGAAAGGGLTYSGSGTLTLSGANNNTGTLTVSAANSTVVITGNETAATGAVALTAGTLDLNATTALGSSQVLTLTGGTLDNTSGAAIALSTTPTVNLSADLTYSTAAGTTANSLDLGAGLANINANRTFTLNGGGRLGLGVLTNTVNSDRSLTVNSGTGTTANTALNLAGITISGVTGATPRTLTINGTSNVNVNGAIVNGIINGANLTYTGSGTLGLFSGTSTYSGTTTAGTGTVATSGTVAIGADSTVSGGVVTSGPVGTGTLLLSGATIVATGGSHTIGNVFAPGNDIAGTIGGSNALTFTGNFNLNGVSGSGAHYTTLSVNNAALTTLAGGINVGTSGLPLQLTLQGSGNILVNSAITGVSNFVAYAGTGTLTLSGANTYTGTTNVTSGTVFVNGTTGTSGSAVNVTGALGGSGTVTANNLTANAGSTLTPGSTGAGSVGTLTVAGNANLASGGNLVFDLGTANVTGGTGGNDLIVIGASGGLTVGTNETVTLNGGMSGTYQLIDYSGTLVGSVANWTVAGLTSSQYSFGSAGSDNGVNSIYVTLAPEPGSIGLASLGGMLLAMRRKRRAA